MSDPDSVHRKTPKVSLFQSNRTFLLSSRDPGIPGRMASCAFIEPEAVCGNISHSINKENGKVW